MTPWWEAAEVVGRVPPETTQRAVGYPALFVLVALGALVPVVPTGALVSSAAVVAFHQQSLPFGVLGVFAVASVAAFCGDVALYWLGQRGCVRGAARAGWSPCGGGPRRSGWSGRRPGWTSTGCWSWCCRGWSRRGGSR